MPQMSPLMWLVLMIMIVVVYSFFVVVNYFIYQTSSMGSIVSVDTLNEKNWSW